MQKALLNFSLKTKLFPLIILMVSFQSFAELPINTHLKDATQINIERTPLYAKLTNQKSVKLSYELITMENLGRLVTIHLDTLAAPYLKAGINIFKDDLTDMRLTPQFSPHFKDNIAPETHLKINTKEIIQNWISKIKENKLEEVYQDALLMLDNGDLQNTNQNCLTRHFVESIARSLMNHDHYRNQAKQLDMEDPDHFLKSYIKIQIQTLSWAQSLDRRAFKFQKENIPIFCQDVPPIQYK